MCRLFAMVSKEPRSADQFLVKDPFSLLAQSHCRKGRYQKDGWGLGFYSGRSAKLRKSPRALYMERPRFKSLARRISSRAILAHIRMASNPLGLPAGRLISLKNVQPFSSPPWIFAHNGTLTIPNEVKKYLGRYARCVKGVNDSEVLFWLFIKHIKARRQVPAALRSMVKELWAIWNKTSKSTKLQVKEKYKQAAPYFGLNCIISDGRKLYALCKHDGQRGKNRSLGYAEQPFWTMCFTLSAERLIVASEKMNRTDKWRLMTDSTLLTAAVNNPTKIKLTRL